MHHNEHGMVFVASQDRPVALVCYAGCGGKQYHT